MFPSARRAATAALAIAAAGAALAAVPAISHAAGGTAYTWVGAYGPAPHGDNHTWSNPNNWSPTGVPHDGDSVVIQPFGEGCSSQVDSIPAVTLGALTIAERGSDAHLCRASVRGGPITVTGAFRWDGGYLYSTLTLPAGSTSTVTNTHRDIAVADADLTLNGRMVLSGGLTGVNALRLDAPNRLIVGPTGSLVSQGDNELVLSRCCVDPARVINKGTVTVRGGTLHVDGLELDNANDVVLSGGTLHTTRGILTASGGARYLGTGTVLVGQGTDAHLTGAQYLARGVRVVLGGETHESSPDLGGTFTLGGAISYRALRSFRPGVLMAEC